jgi:FkbM family methyltransferase
MLRKLYNRLNSKFYYSTAFHSLIAPSVDGKKPTSPEFSFYGTKLLSNLRKLDNSAVRLNDEGRIIFSWNQLSVEITSVEELYILNEILIDGCYNFYTNRPVTVVDIGMNVSIASLFFAAKSNVERIYSFEPFLPTYNQALRNIALNTTTGSKIRPHNFGLAAAKSTQQWDYDYLRKGDTGLRNDFDDAGSTHNVKAKEKVTVTLETLAHPVFNEIFDNPDNDIVFKIDCEGAEYELIEELEKKGLLEKIQVLMIEWHLKGPGKIADILLRNNFSLLNTLEYNKVTGMIYAFNRKK